MKRFDYRAILSDILEVTGLPIALIILGWLIYQVAAPKNPAFPVSSILSNSHRFNSLMDYQYVRILRYYGPDLLWCWALESLLFKIWAPKRLTKITVLVFVCITIAWIIEFSQKYEQIPGSYDMYDLVIFLLGSLSGGFFYYYKTCLKEL